MANTFGLITGQTTPTGTIAYSLYTPSAAATKQCPMIIALHGAGEGSDNGTMPLTGQYNAATAARLDNTGVGLPWLTNSANSGTGGVLPAFTNPVDGLPYEYYILGVQLKYFTAGELGHSSDTNRAFGYPWPADYITGPITWAKQNLNVDHDRIYVSGHSLGGGGSFYCVSQAIIANQIAAVFGMSTGYGETSDWADDAINAAQYGVPYWILHSDADPVAPFSRSQTIVNRINAARPFYSPKLWMLDSSSHNIQTIGWQVNHPTLTLIVNGVSTSVVMNPNPFEWLLQFTKRGVYLPKYT